MKKTPARTAKLIGAGALAASLLAMTGCSPAAPTAAPSAGNGTPSATARATQKPDVALRGMLVRAITGDTIVLSPVSGKNEPTGEPNVTVHILGIKAPALNECGGPEAAAELERISGGGGRFRVDYDTQASRVDSKGNVQGYLYAGDGSGIPEDIGDTMIHNGFAAAWYDSGDHAPKKYPSYSELYKTVQAHKDGIWASCPATSS